MPILPPGCFDEVHLGLGQISSFFLKTGWPFFRSKGVFFGGVKLLFIKKCGDVFSVPYDVEITKPVKPFTSILDSEIWAWV